MDSTRPLTGARSRPVSGTTQFDSDRPMTSQQRGESGRFEEAGMEGFDFSDRPTTGVTGGRPISGLATPRPMTGGVRSPAGMLETPERPTTMGSRPVSGVEAMGGMGSRPVSGVEAMGGSERPMTGYRPESGFQAMGARDRPVTGFRPESGVAGMESRERPMTGYRPGTGVQGLSGHDRPTTGHHFPMDDEDFPGQSRPMTTVSASRPMTKAGGRPGTGQPSEVTWGDQSADGQLQWEEPLDRNDSRPESGMYERMYDRPRTASSRPVSGLAAGGGDLAGRPSTSAVRPASDLDRPQTGAARSRPVTGAGGESRSLSGSRPMTGLSRPVTAYQSRSAEPSRPMTRASRPMTVASRPVSGALANEGRAFNDSAGWDGRPGTSGRPFTGAMTGGPPPGSAGFRPGTQAPPTRGGPMSRMGSGRPMTGAMEKIKVMSRPITQQGLSGMKTAGSGRSRMVQDKSYFLGLLRTKTSELRSEIDKLRRQADSLNQEQATYTTYDTRVKEMAGELLEHQAELADYNVLVELMNMDSDRSLVDTEFEDLKHRNGKEALLVEKLFLSRKEKETEVADIEQQIQAERRLADTLVEAMPGEVRERYQGLQQNNLQLQGSIEQQQQQLDLLTSRKAELDADLAQSPLKQEAAGQYDTLSYLEAKKMELLQEKNLRETPEQERERLLKQVKTNNQEIGTLERQTQELRGEFQRAQEELDIAENDLEDSNSERNLKYRELRKREEEMQEFLATYEETKAEETRGVVAGETEVVKTLELISRNLSRVRHLPSFTAKDLGELRASLSVKEGETSKSKNTLSDLGVKHQQLLANHEKIEALDEKVREEMKTLRENMTKMREEMVILSDLPALKQQNDEKTARLSTERFDCQNRQEATRTQLNEAEIDHSAIKGELDSMDPWIQLGILERRLASIEQNNYSLLEFVASKKSEVDYTPVRSQVMHTIYESNKRLMEQAMAGRATL